MWPAVGKASWGWQCKGPEVSRDGKARTTWGKGREAQEQGWRKRWGSDHAQIWHWHKACLAFDWQEEIRLNVYTRASVVWFLILEAGERGTRTQRGLQIQRGRGEWVWPNWGNWTSNRAWRATAGPEVQEGPGLGAEKTERAAEGKKRQQKVRGATTSIVNCLSAGLEDVLVGLIGIKAQGGCCASRNMLEAVRAHWGLSHPLSPQAVMNMRCKPQLEENTCWTRWRTAVCWCSGQRKPPLIWSTQGRQERRKNLRWALEVMTNLKRQRVGRKPTSWEVG